MIVSFRSIGCCFLAGLMLCAVMSIRPVKSDVIVPYEWIVPGAYARYTGGAPQLFFPNHTSIFWNSRDDVDETFLEWTVVGRVGDSVQLNVTFFVEGTAWVWYTESVPDGKVNIMDIATAAKAYGKQTYEWGYDYNADVIEDGKVDIMDIATVAKAYGASPDDPDWNSKADIAPEKDNGSFRHVVHHRNLLLEIDVYSRDTFFNGESWGKTCFWAEPYADIGDEVVLYGLPPEEIVGTVERIWDVPSDIDYHGISVMYEVVALHVDPFCPFYPVFDWNTGMATQIYFQGSEPVNPDGDFNIHFPNGTVYKITRFASTPLGTELNIGQIEHYVGLNSTNIQLGPPP